jgi:hypothetical protein
MWEYGGCREADAVPVPEGRSRCMSEAIMRGISFKVQTRALCPPPRRRDVPMIVYPIVDFRSSAEHPLGDAVETFVRRSPIVILAQ